MVTKEEMLTEKEEQEFQGMLDLLLIHEGGYVNNKDDPGGETNFGITQKTYKEYQDSQCQEKNLKPSKQYKSVKDIQRPEVTKIYRTKYYIKFNCHKINDINTRFHYFDMMVNHPTTGLKICQKATNIRVDGKLGKQTLNAINSANQVQLQKQMAQLRREHFNNQGQVPKLKKFLKGWTNRVDSVDKIINSGQLGKLHSDSSNSRPSTQSSLNQVQKQPGGVDLNINIDSLKNIKGINKFSTKFIKDNKQNIQLSDLATVLRVYADPNISSQHKQIVFSLDPVIIQNQSEFKEQEKVIWPDKFLNKNIIMDTDLSRILFESDFLMKLMSLGVSQDGKTPFPYPQELKNRGLKPTIEFQGENISQQMLCRFWLVPDSCTYSYHNDKYIIEDVKVICQSRQVERINNQLEDRICQDPKDSNYQFAQKFTELYDLISQFYPVFKRLQQVFKAVVLGKWMYENNLKVDLQILQKYIQQQNNYPYKIPIIKYEKSQGNLETPIFHTQQEKIQIAKDFLVKNGHQTTQANIDQILPQIPDQKAVQVEQRMLVAMGGIDPNCKKLIEKQPQVSQKCKTYDDIINESTDDESDIPFIQTIQCKDCSRNVENNLVMLNQTQCSIHNDYTCYVCLQLITKEDKNPQGLMINEKQYGFHAECLTEYLKEYNDEEY